MINRHRLVEAKSDGHNRLVWLSALFCLLGILVLALPEFLNAEAPHSLPAKNKSLQLNEQAVQAAAHARYDEAEALLRQSLDADAGNVSAAFNLASVLIARHKEQEAIVLLRKYKEHAPEDARLMTRLGDAYFSAKQIDDALDAYKRALSLDSQLDHLHQKLAAVYSLKNDLPRSEIHLEKASTAAPENAALIANLAGVKLAAGKVDEAIAHAKRAIQLDPTAAVYVTLGTAYELNKDYPNSIIAFERARDLGDARPELAAKIRELNQQ